MLPAPPPQGKRWGVGRVTGGSLIRAGAGGMAGRNVGAMTQEGSGVRGQGSGRRVGRVQGSGFQSRACPESLNPHPCPLPPAPSTGPIFKWHNFPIDVDTPMCYDPGRHRSRPAPPGGPCSLKTWIGPGQGRTPRIARRTRIGRDAANRRAGIRPSALSVSSVVLRLRNLAC